jgi:hypothetical protein
MIVFRLYLPRETFQVDDQRHSKQPDSGSGMNHVPTRYEVRTQPFDREGHVSM